MARPKYSATLKKKARRKTGALEWLWIPSKHPTGKALEETLIAHFNCLPSLTPPVIIGGLNDGDDAEENADGDALDNPEEDDDPDLGDGGATLDEQVPPAAEDEGVVSTIKGWARPPKCTPGSGTRVGMNDGYMRVLPMSAAVDSIKEAWTAFQQAERGLFFGPTGLSARGVALQSCQQDVSVRQSLLESAKDDEAQAKIKTAETKELQASEKAINQASAAFAQAKAAHTAAKAAHAEAERVVRDLSRPRPASVCELRELLIRDVSSQRCKTTSNFAAGTELIDTLEWLCGGHFNALDVTAVETLGSDDDALKEKKGYAHPAERTRPAVAARQT
jgi:hypothetical protein